jgi:hypothetical protein
MSCHSFTNLREFQGDLKSKLNDIIESLDFQLLKCNCQVKDNVGLCKFHDGESLGTRGYKLCRHEQLEILKATHKDPKSSINS